MNPQLLREVCESIPDWSALTVGDLERLATALLGRRKGSWVRCGAQHAIIAKVKYGAIAATLPAELVALTRDTRRILAAGFPGCVVSAVAFYHIRFENIHPLHDGNGRIGRTIMTGQLYQRCGISPASFERQLEGRFYDYKQAFRQSADSTATYCRLTDLLHQLTKLPQPSGFLPAGFSLEPLHPGNRREELTHRQA